IGPPGTGKTMLASRLSGIFPPLSNEEALESAAILSLVNADTVMVQVVVLQIQLQASRLIGGDAKGGANCCATAELYQPAVG
ncbi:ATP-binding protein, partial [Salmonella enterica subsp. enterica serovar Montevideo]|nr:ATP-binding protein [Salmonella enterica subsp. enterica serovar Montevideo]